LFGGLDANERSKQSQIIVIDARSRVQPGPVSLRDVCQLDADEAAAVARWAAEALLDAAPPG
jgi:hypothetical protein